MTGNNAWLEYQRLLDGYYLDLRKIIYISQDDCIISRAVDELQIAFKSFFDEECTCKKVIHTDLFLKNDGIILNKSEDNRLGKEGYHVFFRKNAIIVEGFTSVGILYGVFSLLRKIQFNIPIDQILERKIPDNPLRMLNHWDNMDGTIERGYSGRSFFFEDEKIIINNRTIKYARLLASVGINGTVINNVNVKDSATALIDKKYRQSLIELSEIFYSYGIKLYLSVNFAAPMEPGNLHSADPLNDDVKSWWQTKSKDIFEEIPNLGGFLVKADSEGRPGPFTYGRTHVDGANMLADAVQPFGGLIIWRCFVYNCQQDWRDRKTDRARSGYDNFQSLDGKFRENVILQIKNGPMDFQVREPISPLFGALKQTNQIMEVQVAQEYTGQQKHICYLIPMFKEVLNFKTYCHVEQDRVADLISGRTYGQRYCGMAAVSNTGNDENWTGHDLAAANLYGFGRLSFDTSLSSEEIAEEWICFTFGTREQIIKNIGKILMMSWPAYEKYTVPLGIGWMVNPEHHYGPNVDGYEYDRWGTYHRADHKGIGIDRSENGTGFSCLYNEPNAAMYQNIQLCPEELLLFFHHISYTHVLSSKKTLIQHIYDTHFDGVEDVEEMIRMWNMIEKDIDTEKYNRVKVRLNNQLEHATQWRDVICSYFYRKSMIRDEKNRTIY